MNRLGASAIVRRLARQSLQLLRSIRFLKATMDLRLGRNVYPTVLSPVHHRVNFNLN